jgi:hypothetical protein
MFLKGVIMLRKRILKGALTTSALALLFSGFTMISNATVANGFGDYGDATGYVPVLSADGSWQRLGTAWDAESSPNVVDGSDDGISWSINGGAFGHEVIGKGASVVFKADVYKELWGTHDFDALKIWIDSDKDKSFETSEEVLAAKWEFGSAAYTNNTWDGANFYANVSKTFYTNAITFSDTGSFWLRARVVCSRDLDGGSYGDALIGNMDNFTSTANFEQGETEDWSFNVPEPSMLLLFGAGLSVLGLIRRKKN